MIEMEESEGKVKFRLTDAGKNVLQECGVMREHKQHVTQEQYTVTSNVNGSDKLCPFCFGGPDPYAELRCAGERCMAWIRIYDEDGYNTGRGRCGMVQQHINQTTRGNKE